MHSAPSQPPGSPAVGGRRTWAAGMLAVLLTAATALFGLTSAAAASVTDTIPVGDRPWDTAVSPDGAVVYVANSSDRTVSVISSARGFAVSPVPVESDDQVVGTSPAAQSVTVTNTGQADLTISDIAVEGADAGHFTIYT